MAEITQEELLRRVSELSCPYGHVRMLDCQHCAKDVAALLRASRPAPEGEGT